MTKSIQESFLEIFYFFLAALAVVNNGESQEGYPFLFSSSRTISSYSSSDVAYYDVKYGC